MERAKFPKQSPPLDESVTFRIPSDLKDASIKRAVAGGFRNYGEYMREIVRRDVEGASKEAT